VEESEVEDGGEEVSRLDCGRSCMRSNLVEREDAKASEATGEGYDLSVDGEGAGRRAKDEEGVLELSVNLFLAARQVVLNHSSVSQLY
jgi:hypothetical protein